MHINVPHLLAILSIGSDEIRAVLVPALYQARQTTVTHTNLLASTWFLAAFEKLSYRHANQVLYDCEAVPL